MPFCKKLRFGERSASIISVTSQKTVFFLVTRVKTSNRTYYKFVHYIFWFELTLILWQNFYCFKGTDRNFLEEIER
jgi:hypothetical protein